MKKQLSQSDKTSIQSKIGDKIMFVKKKLYKIVYKRLSSYTMIIEARNECQALKKFYRKTKYGIEPSIISFEEYKLGQ